MNENRLLFSPIRMGNVKLQNRMIMPAMATNFPSPEGYVTQRHIDYYVERAKGGVGLILVEGAYVDQKGRRLTNQLAIGSKAHEERMRELVDKVHACETHIGLQITHGGRECSSRVTGFRPVGPTNIPSANKGIAKEIEIPEALTERDIEETIDSFVRGAEFAKRAGFDLLEIHAAHGYLLSQFLSPAVNFRRDRYGKDIEGRARIVTELLDKIKARLKDTLPVIVRFNGDDFFEGGTSLPEARSLAHLFEKHGADGLHVSGGFHASVPFYMIPPMGLPHNCLIHLAEGVKKEVSIPVITVGRIVDPRDAEEILRSGKADLVALGRSLIADPDFPVKTKEGREHDIRPCIGCNQGCIGAVTKQLPLTCLVNPAAGRERDFVISKAEQAKKVVIVGAGPAGLEAARVAAIKGHSVVLFEKAETLGGKLNVAKIPPARETIGKIEDYYARILAKLGVDFRLRSEATEETILREKPDEVVMAVGGKPLRPKIPGIDHSIVVFADDVLKGRVEVRGNCVIVGGGMVGVETAEFLLEKGMNVILVEMMGDIAFDMEPKTRSYLFSRLGKYNWEVLVNEKVAEITHNGVITENGRWRKKLMGADHVILAMGAKPDQRLGNALRDRGVKVHFIGDCKEVRNALDAIYEGAQLSLKM
jgi:2,4-dienoyl-CoA reductase-like NADH-dependent reductase (Old Yellow Enzyme family)/thioredoxin reductase